MCKRSGAQGRLIQKTNKCVWREPLEEQKPPLERFCSTSIHALELLVLLISDLPTLRARDLWSTQQPATRGQSRWFGLTFIEVSYCPSSCYWNWCRSSNTFTTRYFMTQKSVPLTRRYYCPSEFVGCPHHGPVLCTQLSLFPRLHGAHGGPLVWQHMEDESVSSGAGWASSPQGIPTHSPLTSLMNLPFLRNPDANPEVLTKRTTASSFRDIGHPHWDISLMKDVT